MIFILYIITVNILVLRFLSGAYMLISLILVSGKEGHYRIQKLKLCATPFFITKIDYERCSRMSIVEQTVFSSITELSMTPSRSSPTGQMASIRICQQSHEAFWSGPRRGRGRRMVPKNMAECFDEISEGMYRILNFFHTLFLFHFMLFIRQ